LIPNLPESPWAVVGLGQIGSALARALARAFPEVKLLGVEPEPRARAQALADRIVTEALDVPGPALSKCGLVFLCVPFASLPPLLAALGPHLGAETLLTDVCPVKAPVDRAVGEALPGVRFVGGHPLIGGEPGALSPSRADVFAGRPVALCPRAGEESLASTLGAIWAALGSRPVVLPAEEHDRTVALTSHLPYLTAVALTRIVAGAEGSLRLTGRALAEGTRHALANPETAAPAVAANPLAAAAARVLADELRRLADLVEREPAALTAAAAEAKGLRGKLVPE
jgi:prephenate dehydrogenase